MKKLKKALSVFLAVIICLAVFPGTMMIKSSAVKYAYTGDKETGVTGTHHWSGNCKGGTSVKALGANEISASMFTYTTDWVGTSGQVDTREMSDSDAPVATYYVDVNDSEYTATLLCERTNAEYAKIINCQFSASDETKNNCSISVGWNNQWYFRQNGSDISESQYVTFTGKTPSAAGEQVEYLLYFMTDIANEQSGYIHAVYKLKIRFVGFGKSDSGKTTVTNTIHRNWPDLYCYDSVISAYNVDGGVNGNYYNDTDGEYAASDSDFLLKSTATAFAYIDRSVYSKLEDTNISFSQEVSSLCANGTGGWSWTGVAVSSDKGTFTSTIGHSVYTIDNTKGSSYLENVYNLPFKVCGDLPSAGDDVNITVTGLYNANATQTGFHYNASTNLILTLYLYDKTELNAKISEAETYLNLESLYSAESFANFKSAYNAAKAVSDSQTVKQTEIDTAKTNLINAIDALVRMYTITWKNGDTVLQSGKVAYGTTPSYTGATPTKDATAEHTYTFSGWSPTIAKVTRDATYEAQFTATVNEYTITWKNGDTVLQSGKVAYGTTPSYTGATPTKDATAEHTYTFSGWSPTIAKVTRDATYEAQFTATVNEYTITWKNGDTVLQSGKVAYGTTPSYTGATPTKDSDDDYEYKFSSWSPTIAKVTGEATYTAQFAKKAHEFECKQLDGEYHQFVCNCGYKKAEEKHTFEYIKSGTGHIYKCKDCGYSYSEDVTEYTVEFTGDIGEVISKSIRSELSTDYYIVTIQAPLKNGDKYFVYWIDSATGEKVSTYRTYSFFQTGDRSFEPVYAELTKYTEERNSAVFSSTVTGVKSRQNNNWSLYAEHSVAKTIDGFPKYNASNKTESIKNIVSRYGVIYTTASEYMSNTAADMESVLVMGGGKDVTDKAAGMTDLTRDLTGVLEVNVETDSDAIWARTYVVDANGTVHYGTPKKITLSADTASVKTETVTTSSISLDTTDLNIETDAPNPGSETTETETTEKSFFDKLVSFLKAVWRWILESSICYL